MHNKRRNLTLLFVILFVRGALAYSTQLEISARQVYNEANCTNVKIPPLLCSKCHMRPHDSNGNFNRENKKDIFDFETSACLAQLKFYVKLNPCDTLRAKYLAEYEENKFAYNRIAQFLYTICEQCCDMIPIGSRAWQWTDRKKEGTLFTKTRGNGVAHFYYDICKLYPDIKRFIGPGWKWKENFPKLCPMAISWMGSKYGVGWALNPDAEGIPFPFKKQLGIMANTLGCYDKRAWKDCIAEERSIGRV